MAKGKNENPIAFGPLPLAYNIASRLFFDSSKNRRIPSPSPFSTRERSSAKYLLKESIIYRSASRFIRAISRHMAGSDEAIRVKSLKPPAEYLRMLSSKRSYPSTALTRE